jgi:Flp pilus assembly protein TadD
MTTTSRVSALLAALLFLGGCATTPRSDTSPSYSSLYDGTAQTLYEASANVQTAGEAKALAEEALRRGDSDMALYLYIKALELGEPDADALAMIGAIHRARGNHALAEAAYQWAVTVDDAHPAANEGLGLVLLRKRSHEETQRLLTRAVEAEPERWQAHNGLGVLADLSRDFDTARAHFEAALQLQPDSPMLLSNLGYSRYLAGDWAGARPHLRRALARDPQHKQARLNLGLLLVREEKYDEAVEVFSQVMKRPEALNRVGYIAMAEGKLTVAESHFLRAIRLSPTYHVEANENLQRLRSLREDQRG